jgi:hypothetical protein
MTGGLQTLTLIRGGTHSFDKLACPTKQITRALTAHQHVGGNRSLWMSRKLNTVKILQKKQVQEDARRVLFQLCKWWKNIGTTNGLPLVWAADLKSDSGVGTVSTSTVLNEPHSKLSSFLQQGLEHYAVHSLPTKKGPGLARYMMKTFGSDCHVMS